MRAVRLLIYEGPTAAIEQALGRSLPDGTKYSGSQLTGYTITVVTLRGQWFRRLRAVLSALGGF
jgi:hypothetical protein